MLEQGFIDEVEALYKRGDLTEKCRRSGRSVIDRLGPICKANMILKQ